MSAQKSKPSGLLGAFAGLVGVSAVAGILVTAMVAPALAVTSMTVNTSIGVFDSIPDYIELTALPQRNTLYAMKGGVATPFAQVFNQNREEVSWSNVSPFVKDAVVAAGACARRTARAGSRSRCSRSSRARTSTWTRRRP